MRIFLLMIRFSKINTLYLINHNACQTSHRVCLILSFSLINIFSALSQSSNLYFLLKEKNTNDPISDALILDNAQGDFIAVTDSSGRFSLSENNKAKAILIKRFLQNDTTITLSGLQLIYLNTSSIQLKEVVISDKKIDIKDYLKSLLQFNLERKLIVKDTISYHFKNELKVSKSKEYESIEGEFIVERPSRKKWYKLWYTRMIYDSSSLLHKFEIYNDLPGNGIVPLYYHNPMLLKTGNIRDLILSKRLKVSALIDSANQIFSFELGKEKSRYYGKIYFSLDSILQKIEIYEPSYQNKFTNTIRMDAYLRYIYDEKYFLAKSIYSSGHFISLDVESTRTTVINYQNDNPFNKKIIGKVTMLSLHEEILFNIRKRYLKENIRNNSE